VGQSGEMTTLITEVSQMCWLDHMVSFTFWLRLSYIVYMIHYNDVNKCSRHLNIVIKTHALILTVTFIWIVKVSGKVGDRISTFFCTCI